MERPWTFVAGTPLDGLAREIADVMVRQFGITEDEAIGRVNRAFQHVKEWHPIFTHETSWDYAHRAYYGSMSRWWISNEDERARQGLPELKPVPFP